MTGHPPAARGGAELQLLPAQTGGECELGPGGGRPLTTSAGLREAPRVKVGLEEGAWRSREKSPGSEKHPALPPGPPPVGSSPSHLKTQRQTVFQAGCPGPRPSSPRAYPRPLLASGGRLCGTLEKTPLLWGGGHSGKWGEPAALLAPAPQPLPTPPTQPDPRHGAGHHTGLNTKACSHPPICSLSLRPGFPLSPSLPTSQVQGTNSSSASVCVSQVFHSDPGPGEGVSRGPADVLTGTQTRANQPVKSITSERKEC